MRLQPTRHCEGEPRLSDTAGAGQGDEAMPGDEVQDRCDLGIPADQLRNRFSHIGRRSNRYRPSRGGGGLVRTHRYPADLSGELVAPPEDGSYQPPLRAEGGAQGRNLYCQIIFVDHPARPDA